MNDDRWGEVKAVLALALEVSPAERFSLLDRLCGDDAELRKAVESLLRLETRANALMDSAASPGAALQMPNDRQDNLEEIYSAALRLDAAERATFMRQACGEDDALRVEIESLLAQQERLGSFLKRPAIEVLAGTESIPGETAETVIGRYRLLQKVGEGGMGEVWLAEQREPVRRRVAIKLVKAGMNTREVMARFESERQALALMDHPAIAKVFDAGSTPRGAPYFVMEYVAGVPITTYCDNHRLSTRERLELFIHVSEGVQHAHQKAIIHRDLKPSNILVTEVDGKAAPKIIDFGVAKALAQKLTVDTILTRVGALIGTPEYMSPEQGLSSGEDIDTRTDVYSLGIILYELLAGVPPLELHQTTFEEFLRRLREEEPLKPSTKIRTQDPGMSTTVALKRRSDPLTLAKQMRGDLDAIALKALEKDRSRRYGSPADLAADLRRYLNKEAVLAVAPSVAYRTRKFAYRHRGALATAAAFVLVLIAAATISIWQSIRATKQRDRADKEAAVAQAVNDFLQNDLLAQASASNQSRPSTKPDPDLRVRTALDRAAVRVAGKFDRQPEVEASIRDTIGQTYMDLGLYPEARTQLERALELYRRALGAENPKTLKMMSRLGRTAELQGKYTQAEALLSPALQVQRRVLGFEHPDTLDSMHLLANVYYRLGKYPQAEALHSQTLEIRRRLSGPDDPEALASMSNLALVYSQQGKYPQAEALHRQTLEIRRRVLGPEHPDTLNAMNSLAIDYGQQGKYAQAETLYSQSLEIKRRVLGPEHPDTLMAMINLATTYHFEGKSAQAEALNRQTLELDRRVIGPEHPDTLATMDNSAIVYTAEGKYAQAEALFRQTLEISGRVLGHEHPLSLAFLTDFATMYQRQGKYSLVETYTSQALAGRRSALGSEHPDTMASAADLALAYMSERKFAQSEPLAREALDFNRRKQPDDWQRFRAESLLGASLAGQKKYAEAEPLLLEGYQGMVARKERIGMPDWYHLDRAREWIVQLYQAWNQPEKAAEWRKK
jgi:serine/threonine protein kinase/Tfp pilus assembly protein PilF